MPDDDNVEEVGTFDSSGAFVSNKVSTKYVLIFVQGHVNASGNDLIIGFIEK